MTAADGLDQLTDRLYALVPADFVSARDDAVRAARAEGDRPRATAIGKLRRPTVAAWLVNLLALRRSDLLGELLVLGAHMRTAQNELRGPALRELATQRRGAIAGLVAQACDLAVASGAARSGLPVAEVEATLTAAVADETIAREVLSGRLLKSVHYDGFGETPRAQLHLVPNEDQDHSAVRPSETTTPSEAPARRPTGKEAKPVRPQAPDPAEILRAAEAARDDARDAVSAAEVVHTGAIDAVADATARLADVEARLLELRRERVTAQTALKEADESRLAASQSMDAAKRALTVADRAANRAAHRAAARSAARGVAVEPIDPTDTDE